VHSVGSGWICSPLGNRSLCCPMRGSWVSNRFKPRLQGLPRTIIAVVLSRLWCPESSIQPAADIRLTSPLARTTLRNVGCRAF